jgi:2-keto-4-pentenoate hydratase/2-oxohepta-3-ene-1,7-dioic acid hydratase in catechol pathway
MKLVTFSIADGKRRPGVLIGNTVLDLSEAGYADTLAVIAAGLTKAPSGTTLPLDDVKLHAPLGNPPRVFAIGLNYRDHAREAKMALPDVPVVFFKLLTAIIGPGEAIVLPRNSKEPDYEAELAFVIGKGGYRIPAAAWREHVYGYTAESYFAVVDGQELSDVLPHGAGHCDGGRDCRSAPARNQPLD